MPRTLVIALFAVSASAAPQEVALVGAHMRGVTWAGRQAVELTEPAMIDGSDFADGTIEIWVAGHVPPNPRDTTSRAFVGIAFRASDDGRRFENIYLRMTNGRAEDQLRRNHAVHSISSSAGAARNCM